MEGRMDDRRSEPRIDHGRAFWKPAAREVLTSTGSAVPPAGTAVPPAGSAVPLPDEEDQHEEEEPDDNAHQQDIEEDETHGEEYDSNDPLQLKLGDEIIKWTVLDDGVTVDQRSKDGFTWKQCAINWPSGLEVAEFRTALDCWNIMFPFQFFFGVNEHTWDAVRGLISAFNTTRMQNVKPGTEVVMDESMGKWIPMFEGTPEGVPHLTKIIRKQCGVGIEYKDVADVNTGIILFLEIQEGAELMASKKYCDQYPKHVALTLRLTEFLHGKGHVVYGDSYFASFQTARALLAHGTYFTGLVKNATKGFPKKFLNDVGWSVTAQRACLSPQLEKGPGIDFSRPADVLVPNWSLSNPAAFDLKVIHPLNTDLILEASLASGNSAEVGEIEKHAKNDQMCARLGWTCIPLVVEVYGGWGCEAKECYSRLSKRLAMQVGICETEALCQMYCLLAVTLMRQNARAILLRCARAPLLEYSH
eukprot:Em0014g734a